MPTDFPERPRIDFSAFHPLDHSLLRCFGYPGGWRRHLGYRWEFIWGPQLGRIFLCSVGRHRYTPYWTFPGMTWAEQSKLMSREPLPPPTGSSCNFCRRER